MAVSSFDFAVRTRRPRRARCAAAIAAVLCLTAGCGQPPAPAERPLRIALNSGPFTLDPHTGELISLSVLRNLYDALTAFDAGNRVRPALAESWENPDELTWIFHLRRGVSFHDGSEFTARDVLFSFERARRTPNSKFGSYLIAIDKVLALDPHTVEITTRRPYPILLNKVAFVLIVPVGSPPVILRPVGTGPYRLASQEPGKRLVLRAFDRYWGGPAQVPSVEFLPLPDHEARVAGLIDGDLDIVEEPDVADVGRIRAARGCRIAEQTSLGVTYLAAHTGRRPLADLRTRQAISLALDRGALVREALRGEGEPIGQMVTRNVFGFAPDIPPPAASPAAARALLVAAGYPGGLDLVLQIRPGLRRELDALSRQLAAAGIRVRAVERPIEEFSATDVDLSFAAWFCLSGDASDFFDAMAHSVAADGGYGAGNFIHYRNPTLDASIEDSEATLNMLTRRVQLEHSMHLLMADLAYIPLYSTPVLYGTRDTVDWQPRGDDLILANTIQRRAARR